MTPVNAVPRWLHWTTLVAMSGIFLSQVGAGFDRPLEIVTGCLAAGLAAWSTVALVTSAWVV